MHVFEAVAEQVTSLPPTPVFTVIGDGNMMWIAVAHDRHDIRFVHTRHENGAVAMADGWARATGAVGVATVTQGPGLTNCATSLAVARDHGTPLLLITGETRLVQHADRTGQLYQRCDQAALVESLGCVYHAAHDPSEVASVIARAHEQAAREAIPVVVGIPGDILNAEVPMPPRPAATAAQRPEAPAVQPVSAGDVDDVCDMVLDSQRVTLIAGRAAIGADWVEDVAELAEQIGAALATTLRGRGLFDGHRLDVGVAGGYATPGARSVLQHSDCVVVMGGSLRSHTLDYGALAPDATIIHVDPQPTRTGPGFERPNRWVGLTAAEFMTTLRGRGHQRQRQPDSWVAELKQGLGPETFTHVHLPDGPESGGLVHPASASEALHQALAKNTRIVLGVGHFWWYPLVHLRDRRADRILMTYDFGCVGQALPTGIGASLAEPGEPVVIVEGDLSLMMAVSELETLVRLDANVLVVVMNDGASSAEKHQLAERGWDSEALVTWEPIDFAASMRAFGGRAASATTSAELSAFVESWQRQPGPALIDVRIDPDIVNPITAAGLRQAPASQRKVPV